MFRKSQPNAFKNLRNASQPIRWTLKNASHTFKSVPVYAEILQNICNLIQSESGRYGLDAHDVRTVVKQFDLGPGEIRGLSSQIFYKLRSDNFHLVDHYWKTHSRYKQPRKHFRYRPKRTISSRRWWFLVLSLKFSNKFSEMKIYFFPYPPNPTWSRKITGIHIN